jgi:FkbM family methyltransferase
MKKFLNYLLARKPLLYQNLLRFKVNPNFDKIIFLNLVRNGDIVFDIGANRGYYTLLFSHLVGKDGQVHAFEPIPPTFEYLSERVFEEKRFDNIYLNEVAAGEKNETTNLQMPDGDDGQASMKIHASGSWEHVHSIKTFLCKVVKLDDYAKDKQVTRLNFLKCDVEGAELFALKGLTDLLHKASPILYLEVCADWTKSFGYGPGDLINMLSSFGYSDFYVVTNKIQHLRSPIIELSSKYFSGSVNLLCTTPQHDSPRLEYLVKTYI